MSQETDPKENLNNNDQSHKIEKGQANGNISEKSYSERFGDLNNKQNAKPYVNDDLVQKPAEKGSNNTTDKTSE